MKEGEERREASAKEALKPIFLVRKDGTRIEVGGETLANHLTAIGLSGVEMGPTYRNFLIGRVLEWAEFEINEDDNSVRVQVDRDDGTKTKVTLKPVWRNKVKLEVKSGVQEDEASTEFLKVEFYGYYPGVTEISLSVEHDRKTPSDKIAPSQEFIRFYGDFWRIDYTEQERSGVRFGYIQINQNGTIEAGFEDKKFEVEKRLEKASS